MILQILSMVAPFLIQFMKWFGFKEEQQKKFMDWVHTKQQEASQATLAADQEKLAEQKLKERIEQETSTKKV